jgi:hypothetical protein
VVAAVEALTYQFINKYSGEKKWQIQCAFAPKPLATKQLFVF